MLASLTAMMALRQRLAASDEPPLGLGLRPGLGLGLGLGMGLEPAAAAAAAAAAPLVPPDALSAAACSCR